MIRKRLMPYIVSGAFLGFLYLVISSGMLYSVSDADFPETPNQSDREIAFDQASQLIEMMTSFVFGIYAAIGFLTFEGFKKHASLNLEEAAAACASLVFATLAVYLAYITRVELFSSAQLQAPISEIRSWFATQGNLIILSIACLLLYFLLLGRED